ncbi:MULTISPECIES: bacteriocin [Sphingobacterium]|uniref:bacteriocin n=1 Tax=Sphingobacterium TaxID=28453 RepID=UPI0013DB281B|nr:MULTISPECIES: bacteriocin [unclassified Sphingobacterium]
MNILNLQELSEKEMNSIEGGFIVEFIAIGAIAAAGVAIYEAGRYTGSFIKNHVIN